MKTNKGKRYIPAMLLLVGTAVVFGACSSSGSSAPADYAAADTAAEAAYDYEDYGGYEEFDDYTFDADAAVDYDYEAEPAAEGATPDARASAAGSGVITSENTDPNRKIITTVDLQMESVEYDRTVTEIYDAMGRVGGYVEKSNIVGGVGASGQAAYFDDFDEYYSYDRRHLTMRIRIPQGKLAEFLGAVESSGQVLAKQEEAKDVTLSYTDMEAHKKVLVAQQERVMALLEETGTLEEMIYLEGQLTQLRYQIESLESQLRVMENQVSYSTVNLELSEVLIYTEKPVEPIPDPTVGQRISLGFQYNLQKIGNFWTDVFVWVAVNSIYLLGWAAFFFVCWLVYRRICKKRGVTPLMKRLLHPEKKQRPVPTGPQAPQQYARAAQNPPAYPQQPVQNPPAHPQGQPGQNAPAAQGNHQAPATPPAPPEQQKPKGGRQ